MLEFRGPSGQPQGIPSPILSNVPAPVGSRATVLVDPEGGAPEVYSALSLYLAGVVVAGALALVLVIMLGVQARQLLY